MENLLQQLINLVIALVCWILLAAVGKPLNEGLGNVQKGIGDLFEAVIKLLERAGGGAHQTSSTAQQTNKKFWQGVEAIFNKIIDALNTVTSVLRGHWSEVADQLGSRENRPWRGIGALVYLAAMIVFVYADMIQGANNVAALFRDIDLGLPDFLTNLVIPLLTASVGSAVMLGMIIHVSQK